MEVKPIGDKTQTNKSSDLLSPSVKSSRKTAQFATFPEGEGDFYYLLLDKQLLQSKTPLLTSFVASLHFLRFNEGICPRKRMRD